MGQIIITHTEMSFKNCFHKNAGGKDLRSIQRKKKCLTLWLKKRGNKYFGTSSSRKENTLISWIYKVTAQHPHPLRGCFGTTPLKSYTLKFEP